tara:strand:- start:73 stop:354 length:282 start_codon:yes stop_codon:yes gene_type:complete
MNLLDELRSFFNTFLNKEKPNVRQMKRVFQFRRYLDWKDLTSEEKVSAKRFLLLPVFAYLIIEAFNQNFSLIVLFLIGYILYKKFEKSGIVKK